MEKKMENEMETVIIQGFFCVAFHLGILWYPIMENQMDKKNGK